MQETATFTPQDDVGSPLSLPPQRISYTLQNAAALVDLSTATLRRLEKAGRLRFIRIGGRTLVCARSLHALASAREPV
jgi:excisionase family DNA binding protein